MRIRIMLISMNKKEKYQGVAERGAFTYSRVDEPSVKPTVELMRNCRWIISQFDADSVLM